ncbi:MAG: amidohydrolase [Pseudomonadales bacterium]|nr:amidohydrolase [Pseudomonadales bacterium]
MKKSILVLVAFGLAAVAVADTTLISNINGYTFNSNQELVQFSALQFTDDRVDHILTEAENLPKEGIRVIDGNGQTLLPGLIDAHGHILSYGRLLLQVDLGGSLSETEAAQRVADFYSKNEELEWIQGRGWNQVLWESNEFPGADSLDLVVSDKPVWLRRIDGHAGWANTKAMELAGVTRESEDPNGGQIIRDENGYPTGVFIDTAMNYIASQIPSSTTEELKNALSMAMNRLASYGLTAVHDAGVSSQTIAAYKQLAEEGPLPIRVNVMLAASDPLFLDRLEEGYFRSDDDTLTINSVKIVGDGALGSRGAALIEDYSDDSDNRGLLRYNDERLEYLMRVAMNGGFQVNTHAIGDNANMKVLDNYERLISETDSRNLRHRIEHAQILRYEDILRFAKLGVIPSMQATHATSDKNMAQDRIGEVRIQGAYAWRKLMQADTLIANGSDFPVESPDPFWGLHASVTRQDQSNEPPGGWLPDERMSLEEAFASFTVNAAFAGHQENLLGTLEAGKKADFIIIDRDIFKIPENELWQTQALETWVNGEKITD